MKVWVVFGYFEYENQWIIGIYSDEEEAHKAMTKLEQTKRTQKMDMPHYADGYFIQSYTVQETCDE